MLYRPTETSAANSPATTPRRFPALRTLLEAVAAQFADRNSLDAMRPDELEDLGLRRTESRDYATFR